MKSVGSLSAYCLARNLNGWHISVHSMGRSGGSLCKLTVALHGLLGRQDERRETGEGLRQLQEWMLRTDQQRETKTVNQVLL